MAKLTTYMWDTDIGKFVAVAKDVDAARTQLMGCLSPKDSARDELANAIADEPQIIGAKPLAILAYEQ